MNVLYVTSDRPGAGKTVLAASLLDRLRRAGRTVGYFKPISIHATPDRDTVFIQDVVLGGDSSAARVPVAITLEEASHFDAAEVARRVKASVEPLITPTGLLLIEGPGLYSPQKDLSMLSVQLAQHLNAKVVVVIHYSLPFSAEEVMKTVSPFREGLLGILINSIARYRVREVRQELAQIAWPPGVKLLGCIPEDRLMLAVTVGHVAHHINGQWVRGQEKADDLVESFLIGGNIMDSGETYFGRSDNKAVIVRGDRPDIQLAALTTPTRCLILTGGHQPVEYVYHEVEQLEVPLIVAPNSTMATAEALGSVLEGSDPYHPKKLERFQELLERYGDLKGVGDFLQ